MRWSEKLDCVLCSKRSANNPIAAETSQISGQNENGPTTCGSRAEFMGGKMLPLTQEEKGSARRRCFRLFATYLRGIAAEILERLLLNRAIEWTLPLFDLRFDVLLPMR